jgi:DNA-binding beta-propeller fold protein YncE
VQLVRVRTYSDRDEGTLEDTLYFSTHSLTYDYGNTGTLQVFEPLLDGLSTLTKTMQHILDFTVSHPELDVSLRNLPYRLSSRLSDALMALNIESAEVELSEILLDWDEGPEDLASYTGDEHTVFFRGTVIALDTFNRSEIILTVRDIAARFDEKAAWWGEDPSHKDALGGTDSNDLELEVGIRAPVVFGSPITFKPKIWHYPSFGTLAEEIGTLADDPTPGSVDIEADSRFWTALPDVIINGEVFNITSITDEAMLISARDQTGTFEHSSHGVGSPITEIQTAKFIACHGTVDLMGSRALRVLSPWNKKRLMWPVSPTPQVGIETAGQVFARFDYTTSDLRTAYAKTRSQISADSYWVQSGVRTDLDKYFKGLIVPSGDSSYVASSTNLIVYHGDAMRYLVQEKLVSLAGSQVTASLASDWDTVTALFSFTTVDTDVRWLGRNLTEMLKRIAAESFGNFVWNEGVGKFLAAETVDFEDYSEHGSSPLDLGTAATPYGCNANPNADIDEVYFCGYGSDEIHVIDSVAMSEKATSFAVTSFPRHCVLEADGATMYVGCSTNNLIRKFTRNPSTGVWTEVTTGGWPKTVNTPFRLALTPSEDYLLIAAYTTGLVRLKLSDLTTSTYAPSGVRAYDVVVEDSGTHCWFVDRINENVERILISNMTSVKTIDISAGSNGQGLALDESQSRIYVSFGAVSETLRVYNTTSGSLIYQVALPDTGWYMKLGVNNTRIFIGTSDGWVVLNAATGATVDQMATTPTIHDVCFKGDYVFWSSLTDDAVEIHSYSPNGFETSYPAASVTFDQDNVRGSIDGDLKELADLVPNLRVFYQYDPSTGGSTNSEHGFRALASAARNVAGVSFLENPLLYYMLTTIYVPHANAYALFLLSELSARKWTFRFEADWVDAYALELGDIVTVDPPWLDTDVKARVISVGKNFDTQAVQVFAVEVA